MDDDGVFINETMIGYCAGHGIEFSRSRAYRSNDQAWIEQENGSVVRRFAGHDRYSGQVAGQTMAHLYGALRRYVNLFQPSFKMIDQADRQDSGRRHHRQALQSAHHALQPADPARRHRR